ncbi:histone-lysine N-methyltransferase ATX3 [Dorcoceras hygrometricum]|uniref:Histone-lysine N-methyltransferase ATX3 n=1 Tax=Dorcoceras hygrometricum TaxID=472368 RepID=A0A2Z7B0S4_9LAMI|nr:histone-lysine N-methyltransferase ATX3 [Dorcoceras hygrometricum]
MVDLIFGDIEFLIQLREHVIDEVSAFFNSFSLRRLAVLTSLNKDIVAKEENVLTWAETNSVQVALQRNVYILASIGKCCFKSFWSHTEKILVQDNLGQGRHTGYNGQPCCSMLFEDVFDRGFYIPRNHKIFVSTCWLCILRRIGDVWVVEDGYDRWVHEDETPVSQLLVQFPQRTSLEYLAPICLFSQPVQCLSASTSLSVKTWGWYRILDSVLPEFSAQISSVLDISSAPTDFVLSSPQQSSSSATSMHLTDDIPQEANKSIRVKAPQNDTVPTYLNDAVAQYQQTTALAQAKQPSADHSSISKTIHLLVARNIQNDDASTNPNDVTLVTQALLPAADLLNAKLKTQRFHLSKRRRFSTLLHKRAC